MQCSHCDQDHPEGTQFCPMTGKKIVMPNVCPECEQPVDPDWMHCSNCGQPLNHTEEVQALVDFQMPITREEVDVNPPVETEDLTPEEIEFKQIRREPVLRCPHCNEEHPEDSQFCPTTGRKILLPYLCPECGKSVDPNWQHCGYCGRELIQVVAMTHPQEQQAEDSPKAHWLIIGVLIVAGTAGILCLLIGAVMMFSTFWKATSPGESTPTASIVPTQAAISPAFTSTPDYAFMTASAALAQTATLPAVANIPSTPNCPGNKIQSVKEVYENDIMLLEICANDQIIEIGNLAYGVSRIGPNNMFFIYITLYGDVYTARVGDVKLTYLSRIKFFTMINKNDIPKLEISFLGEHPYKLYVKETVLQQSEIIPIPRYITSPGQ